MEIETISLSEFMSVKILHGSETLEMNRLDVIFSVEGSNFQHDPPETTETEFS